MKRFNPKTNLPFKKGFIREDGKVFRKYNTKLLDSFGFFEETWMPLKSYQREVECYHISRNKIRSTKDGFASKTIELIKWRAKKKQVPFNLTAEYLTSIAPDECPVFKTKLYWGVGNKNSMTQPSVDRIVPEKGYTVGNVRWVSNLANSMKFTATPKQLHQFADWVKSTIPNE
jgi:hypothetical protein